MSIIRNATGKEIVDLVKKEPSVLFRGRIVDVYDSYKVYDTDDFITTKNGAVQLGWSNQYGLSIVVGFGTLGVINWPVQLTTPNEVEVGDGDGYALTLGQAMTYCIPTETLWPEWHAKCIEIITGKKDEDTRADTTEADQIRRAMEIFDAHQRHQYWSGWEQHPSNKRAISFTGRLYPVRHIMEMVNRTYELQNAAQLKGILQGYGFAVLPLSNQKRKLRQSSAVRSSDLPPRPVRFGLFAGEKEFCERFMLPLVEQMGYQYQSQYPCKFRTGRDTYSGRVDIMVLDQQVPITVIEAKQAIYGSHPTHDHIEQARSYAVNLGIDMFIIAAPEGLWVYHLRRIHETLLRVFRPSEKDSLAVELRQLIQKQRTPLT